MCNGNINATTGGGKGEVCHKGKERIDRRCCERIFRWMCTVDIVGGPYDAVAHSFDFVMGVVEVFAIVALINAHIGGTCARV